MAAAQKYYETPEHVIAAAVGLSIMDMVALGLRFWTRRKQIQPFKMDDWLLVPATVMTVGIAMSMVYGVSQEALGYRLKIPAGFTGDPQELVTDQLVTTSKIEWAFASMLPLILGCIKASFLFFYMRIFVVDGGARRKLIAGLIVFIALWSFAFCFATLFECRLNFWAVWGSVLDLRTQCFETMQLVLVLCITDFVTDVVILSIPIPMIWRLNLSLRSKIAISVVFLLGAVTIAASLTRLIIMARAVAVGFAPDSDSILVITEYLYWGLVECAGGVCAACLPTLQVLVSKRSFKLPTRVKILFKNEPPRSPSKEHTVVHCHPVKLAHGASNSTSSGPTTLLPSVTSGSHLSGSTDSFVMTDVRIGQAL